MYCSENRYLLFLTENYAALQVLEHYIHEPLCEYTTNEESEAVTQTQSCEAPMLQLEQAPVPWKMEPFILFGSSFPKDMEYTQVRTYWTQLIFCACTLC